MEGEKKHSKIGASSCARWSNCPGSIKLSDGMESKPSEYAAWGTVAHGISERTLRRPDLLANYKKVQKQPEIMNAIIGSKVRQDGFDIEVTEEMVECIKIYVFTVCEYLERHKLPASMLKVEQGFNLANIDKDAFGTFDAVIVIPFRKIIVFDLKTGYKQVEAKNNLQLKYYALGALQNEYDIDEVEMVIIQPRGYHKEGPVRSWTCTSDELSLFAEELRKSIKATQQENAPLVTGDWCKYCPANAKCPKIIEESLSVSGVMFDAVEEVTQSRLPTMQELSPERLSALLKFGEIFENWYSVVCAYAKDIAEAGTPIPGYKLVAKRTVREWADEIEAEKQMTTDLPEGAFEVKKTLLTPTKAEKVYKRLKKDMPPTVKKDNGNTLVPDTDGRLEVRTIETSFSQVVCMDDL